MGEARARPCARMQKTTAIKEAGRTLLDLLDLSSLLWRKGPTISHMLRAWGMGGPEGAKMRCCIAVGDA